MLLNTNVKSPSNELISNENIKAKLNHLGWCECINGHYRRNSCIVEFNEKNLAYWKNIGISQRLPNFSTEEELFQYLGINYVPITHRY